MPRPQNPHELIHAPTATLQYPDWVEHVGDRAVFRISGLYEYRILAGRDDSGKNGFANPDLLTRAVQTFNEANWGEFCTAPRNPLTASGVRRAIHATDGRRTRVSLHTAFVVTLMLEHYLANHNIDADIYEGGYNDARPTGIKIVPYIFDVPGADASAYNAVLQNAGQIKQATGQHSSKFIEHMCKCEEMFSERTAQAVHDICGMTTGLDMVVNQPRDGGRKMRKSCALDKIVYPLA